LTTPGSPPDPSFVDWCRAIGKSSSSSSKIVASEFFGALHKKALNDADFSALIKTINQKISEGSLNHIKIDHPLGMRQQGDANVICGKNASYENAVFEIEIIASGTGLTLKDLFVTRIKLDCRHGPIILDLNNCTISNIDIVGSLGAPNTACLQITNSRIGQIIARPKSIENLSITGGTVLNIITPPPGAENPFIGEVSFSNVFFPRTSKYMRTNGPQLYRNLCYHLMDLHNEKNANIVHSAELAIERESDSPFNKFISFVYETLSDFGNSTLRPVFCFMLFSLFAISFITYFDGSLPGQSQSNYIGWQKILLEDNLDGKIARAIVLTGQQILNPLGLLGHKGLTVARNGWILAISIIYSLLSLILITLFIFAVRRRFKLH
jgi:hypothetical protein